MRVPLRVPIRDLEGFFGFGFEGFMSGSGVLEDSFVLERLCCGLGFRLQGFRGQACARPIIVQRVLHFLNAPYPKP